ncbi:hypothetical protein diail_5105 [Diaporthe ilicicola]|nr:hypothetical protein diail_5105 [Diaporthe ilicicola]
MLFIGTITRMIEGDKNKHHHVPAAYPAVVGVPMPCNCRGDRFCAACSPQHHHGGGMVPMISAAPLMSHLDARREWRYERRAMRDSRRAARRGYGYGYPVTVPFAPSGYGAGNSGYARDYYEAGPSSSRASPERRRDECWEDDGLTAPAGFSTARVDRDRRDSSPPKYEVGNWEPRRTSVEVLAEGKKTY